MVNLTTVISETIFMELEQIIDLQYKKSNKFVITDNCGESYVVTIEKAC